MQRHVAKHCLIALALHRKRQRIARTLQTNLGAHDANGRCDIFGVPRGSDEITLHCRQHMVAAYKRDVRPLEVTQLQTFCS